MTTRMHVSGTCAQSYTLPCEAVNYSLHIADVGRVEIKYGYCNKAWRFLGFARSTIQTTSTVIAIPFNFQKSLAVIVDVKTAQHPRCKIIALADTVPGLSVQ